MNLFKSPSQLKEILLAAALGIAALVLFIHYWEKPKRKANTQIQATILQARTEIDTHQKQLDLLKKQPAPVADLRGSAELMEKYVKSNHQFSAVMTSIASGDEKNPYLLNRISNESHSQVNGFTQTLYKIELEATFVSIGKFLERLEDSPLLTEVDSIEINRVGNELKRCKTNIRLFSYVARSP